MQDVTLAKIEELLNSSKKLLVESNNYIDVARIVVLTECINKLKDAEYLKGLLNIKEEVIEEDASVINEEDVPFVTEVIKEEPIVLPKRKEAFLELTVKHENCSQVLVKGYIKEGKYVIVKNSRWLKYTKLTKEELEAKYKNETSLKAVTRIQQDLDDAIVSNKVKDEGNYYVAIEELKFDSPSGVCNFLLGRPINGKTMLYTEDGYSLAENLNIKN